MVGDIHRGTGWLISSVSLSDWQSSGCTTYLLPFHHQLLLNQSDTLSCRNKNKKTNKNYSNPKPSLLSIRSVIKVASTGTLVAKLTSW